MILGPVSTASIQEITTPHDNLCFGWRIGRNDWTPLQSLRSQEFSKLLQTRSKACWNFFLTSLFLLYKEHMKDHGPQWATSLVHRRVNIRMELNYWFATEKTCNSKMEGNIIILPSFREMAPSITYTPANPCHKELVCYQTNQMPIHLFCMIANKFTIFTSNFL